MSRVRTSPVFQLVKIGASAIGVVVLASVVAATGWCVAIEQTMKRLNKQETAMAARRFSA